MSLRPLVLLAAGGTGGHLFPAEALSHALRARGVRVALITDTRAAAFAGDFPAESLHAVPAATPSGRSPVKMAGAAWELARGFLAARRVLKQLKPSAVVGFGGYPTVPPLLAASGLGIHAILHEQNGVIGRANRFLANRVDLIATGFAEVAGLDAKASAKCRHVGNPVRPAVLAAAAVPFAEPAGKLSLLVFGGSQGARIMADIVPAAIALLTPQERARLAIVQQARAEDDARVRSVYEGLSVRCDVAPFFKDLPARMAAAHLVIGRSGASTVAELAVIGRPALLVPLPGALDQDQAANAKMLAGIGAATVVPQAEFTPRRLAADLSAYLAEPARLTAMAAAAKSAGIPDAASRLANLVIESAELRLQDEKSP